MIPNVVGSWLLSSKHVVFHMGTYFFQNVTEESLWPMLAAESLKALAGFGALSFGGQIFLRRLFEVQICLSDTVFLLAKPPLTNFEVAWRDSKGQTAGPRHNLPAFKRLLLIGPYGACGYLAGGSRIKKLRGICCSMSSHGDWNFLADTEAWFQ